MNTRHSPSPRRNQRIRYSPDEVHDSGEPNAEHPADKGSGGAEDLWTLLRGMRDSAPRTNSERLLRALLDFSPDAVVLVAPDGRIALVNARTEALFGYGRDELLGNVVEVLIPARLHAGHRHHRRHYAAEPRTRPMGDALELMGRRKDGSEFPVEVSLSPLQIDGSDLVISAIRDVSTRKALETALRESEARAHAELTARLSLLQTILDQIQVGVYLVRGDDARLVLANRAVPSIWGAEWPEGQPLEAFLAEIGTRVYGMSGREMAGEELATLRALRSQTAVRQQQEVLRHRDGTTLPVLVSAMPLDPNVVGHLEPLGVDGNPLAGGPVALVVHQDVTALRDAERLKDEFVAMAAHELRNPMGTLSVYASMLRREMPTRDAREADDGTWQAEALDGIEQVTRHLVSLTEDLLDVTKLQAGGFWMQIEPHDLAALVRRVVGRIQSTTAQHHIRLVGAEDTIIVEFDVGRMDQVVINLVSNAIKYSPPDGEITVALKRVEEAGRTHAELTVQDHGMGIPAADQARIFSRFARGANARQIEGTGLGLYLSRELIERQGGRIWFASTEDEGTTFFVRMPIWEEGAVDERA